MQHALQQKQHFYAMHALKHLGLIRDLRNKRIKKRRFSASDASASALENGKETSAHHRLCRNLCHSFPLFHDLRGQPLTKSVSHKGLVILGIFNPTTEIIVL